jgi:4-amino-4-deoxy-L-arabinose transferase-like glycosyltransferase
LLDIRFWLFLFFLLRLFHITNPPLEVSHNWRQTTVTMVARNFYEVNPDIMYPRLDIGGDKTGITGMEFPVLNYLIYLSSLLFGYEHWYGRLINLIVSTIGIWFFYKLIKKYFTQELAFTSSIVLLFSIWIVFSRKIMPDTFSISLIIMSIYFAGNYFESKRITHLLLYALFCLLGLLAKLPAGYMLVVLSLFLLDKKIAWKPKVFFLSASLIILLPVFYWYFIWVPHLNKVFGFTHFFMGSDLKDGATEIFSHPFETFFNFYDSALKYIGFAFFVVGSFLVGLRNEKLLARIFVLSTVAFLVIMFKSGFAFYHHNYYIIPLVPVMALLCGYGLMQIRNVKWRYVFLMAISLEGILNYQDDFFIKADDMAIYSLEKDFDAISKKEDLVLMNSGNKPTPMYFAHRKGWVTFNDSIKNPAYLNELKQKGLKFIVILKRSFGYDMELNYPVCVSNPYYTIYKL